MNEEFGKRRKRRRRRGRGGGGWREVEGRVDADFGPQNPFSSFFFFGADTSTVWPVRVICPVQKTRAHRLFVKNVVALVGISRRRRRCRCSRVGSRLVCGSWALAPLEAESGLKWRLTGPPTRVGKTRECVLVRESECVCVHKCERACVYPGTRVRGKTVASRRPRYHRSKPRTEAAGGQISWRRSSASSRYAPGLAVELVITPKCQQRASSAGSAGFRARDRRGPPRLVDRSPAPLSWTPAAALNANLIHPRKEDRGWGKEERGRAVGVGRWGS